MTGREMQYRFNILAKRDDIHSEVIFYYINLAINIFVRGTFTPDGSEKVDFERTQKNLDDLQSIVKKASPINTSNPSTAVYTAPLSSVTDYWFAVRERANILYTDCCSTTASKSVEVIESTMNNVDFRLSDPLSEHVLKYGKAKPLRVIYENMVYLYSDGNYSVPSYDLYYIARPTVVTHLNSSDLPSETHEEIVTLAYNLFIKNNTSSVKPTIDRKE